MKREDMTLLSDPAKDPDNESRCGFDETGNLRISDFYRLEGQFWPDMSTGSLLFEHEFVSLHRLLTKRIAFIQAARSGRTSINRDHTLHLVRALYVDACGGDKEADHILDVVRGAIDLAVQAAPEKTS